MVPRRSVASGRRGWRRQRHRVHNACVQEAVEFFVAQGSYGLLFLALIAAGMGVPLPEDIVFIAGAVLSQRGITDLTTTVTVLAVGVLLGDSILFFLARRLGPTIYGWRFVKRVMSPERRAWVESMIRRYGGLVVFSARHVAGFRGPTFAVCAIHGISYPVFLFFDALALAVSLPLFMALGWFFSDSLEEALAGAASAEQWIMLGVAGLLVLVALAHAVRTLLKRSSAPPPSESP
jgi:membrane protein DedA with SNARE-associated domain